MIKDALQAMPIRQQFNSHGGEGNMLRGLDIS